MNTNQLTSAQLLRGAKAVLDVGQKQFRKTVTLTKNHGRKILNESKAFYQDLVELQVSSMNEMRKALDTTPVKAKATRKKAPRKVSPKN